MKIHCVVIAYGLSDDLLRLYRLTTGFDVTWHLFLHSSIPQVIMTCMELNENDNVRFHDYRVNRGLARSWNDGLIDSYGSGADVVMLLNDDMIPAPGDLERVAEAALEHPEYALTKARGFDLRTLKHTTMEFGFTAVTRHGWETIGCFDENISPVYWEDIDWCRRMDLAGLECLTVDCTSVVHAGSKTMVTVPGLKEQSQQWFDMNRDYYKRKWGRTHQEGELYEYPFNDTTLGLKIAPEERTNPYPGYGVKVPVP